MAVSGLGLIATSTPALAGGCGFGSTAPYCNAGVTVNQGAGPSFGPMSVNIQQPMGHLRSVNYQRAPHTSITRVHGLTEPAALSDFPSNFTNGCNPTSTAYCRQDLGTPVNVEFNAPVAPALNIPLAPRVTQFGGGYDASKFIPRTYGDNTLTPGIAYLPSSYVNRNPADAAAVLAQNGHTTAGYNSGPINFSAPAPSYTAPSFATPSFATPSFAAPSFGTSVAAAPVAPTALSLAGGVGAPRGNYLGSVVTGTTTTASSPSSNAISDVDGSGGYWEQVSGLTMFGDTVATSVVCRRQAPQQTQQVVSPVYGVPTPVPTAVPYYVDVPYKVRGKIPAGCRPVGPVGARAPFPAAMPGVLPYGPTRGSQFGGGFGQYGQAAPVTGWTY